MLHLRIELAVLGLFILAPKCAATVMLNSNPPVLNGTVCEPVIITCNVIAQPSFAWFRDELAMPLVSFGFQNRDAAFPLTLYNQSGIVITVTHAASESRTNLLFNATSELTTTTSVLEMLNVSSIWCGNVGISQSFSIRLNIQAAPPPPIICSLTSMFGDVEVSIQWTLSQQNVSHYRVSVSPDPSSCSSNQVSPTQNYTCSGLTTQVVYYFTASAVTACGSESERTYFQVYPQGIVLPQIAQEVSVQAVFVNSKLNEVTVLWRHKSHNNISSTKCRTPFNYTVGLIDSKGSLTEEQLVNSESCRNGFCSTAFSNLNTNMNYQIALGATNGFGTSSLNVTSFNIIENINATISSANCLTAITCASSESDGNCSIEYGQDSSYENLSSLIQAPVNTPVTLPFLEKSEYYYLITINSSTVVTFLFRGSFQTEAFSARLSSTNLILLVAGVMLLCVDVIVYVLLLHELVKKGSKGTKMIIQTLVAGILTLVSIVLWLAVGFQVGLQKNTCNPMWQTNRDHLVISAHVFAEFALLVLIFSFDVPSLFCKHDGCNQSSNSGPDIQMQQNEVYGLKQPENIQMERNAVYGITAEQDYEK